MAFCLQLWAFSLIHIKARVKAAERKLKIARANAIQQYADLEQALCELFSYLSDTNPIVAGTIFFRITSAHSRRAILDKLMRKKRTGRETRILRNGSNTPRNMDVRRRYSAPQY
jgi:hypothetical protein